MKRSLTTGISKELADDVRKEFYSSAILRKQLSKVLQDKIDSARKANVLVSSYESPNWALKQADNVGYERAILEVMNLIDTKEV